jgi:hypothetical protein
MREIWIVYDREDADLIEPLRSVVMSALDGLQAGGQSIKFKNVPADIVVRAARELKNRDGPRPEIVACVFVCTRRWAGHRYLDVQRWVTTRPGPSLFVLWDGFDPFAGTLLWPQMKLEVLDHAIEFGPVLLRIIAPDSKEQGHAGSASTGGTPSFYHVSIRDVRQRSPESRTGAAAVGSRRSVSPRPSAADAFDPIRDLSVGAPAGRTASDDGAEVSRAPLADDVDFQLASTGQGPDAHQSGQSQSADSADSAGEPALVPAARPPAGCIDPESSPVHESTTPIGSDADAARLAQRPLPGRPPAVPNPPAAAAGGPRRATKPCLVGDLVCSDSPARSRVQMTVFGPAAVRRHERFLLQAIFHEFGADNAALGRSRVAEPTSAVAQTLPLPGSISYGESIAVRLLADQRVRIDEPVQVVQWRSEMVAVEFAVRLPWLDWKRDYFFTAEIDVGGCPIGRCKFRVRIADRASHRESPVRHGQISRYEHAFLSYASEDAAVVADVAQLLEIQGISYFLDKVSLRLGTDWRSELEKQIDNCDLFLLCWSRHAAASSWVAKEIDWALQTQRRTAGTRPDIRPFILEGPPIPSPPPQLRHLHFGTAARFVKESAAVHHA